MRGREWGEGEVTFTLCGLPFKAGRLGCEAAGVNGNEEGRRYFWMIVRCFLEAPKGSLGDPVVTPAGSQGPRWWHLR